MTWGLATISGTTVAGPVVVVLLALLPEIESRGSIPVAVLVYHMDAVNALGWSLLGNLAGIPLAWRLLPALARLLRRAPPLRRPLDWLLAHTRREASRSVQRWEAVGLAVFVGIPLPGTGAWAGVAAAHLLGLSWRRSALPIAAGTVVAALLVYALVQTGHLLA